MPGSQVAAESFGSVDWLLWERELARIGNCANPIHLRGTVDHVDTTTGEVRQAYSTADERGGVLLKRCGSRLAAKCPACAWVYQQDAYQLLKAGLVGGKGLPDSVSRHPRLFVTLTAPSFGEVHTYDLDRAGRPRPCHPRDGQAASCRHGRRLDCRQRHYQDDPRVGEPLCPACYDYQSAVMWNAFASELWTRTMEYTYRALAPTLGVPATKARKLVHLEYAKVAEWQARGQIHFHAVVRLDLAPDFAGDVPRPAPGLTVGDLKTALEHAIVNVPPPDPSGLLGWGQQNELRDITSDAISGEPVTEDRVAGYLAKYATKATEALLPGVSGVPASVDELLDDPQVRRHIARLAWTARELACQYPVLLRRLARHARTLGYGGHFLTKSRRYSTTFTRLRRTRIEHRRSVGDAWDRPIDPDQVEVVSTFTYVRSGHRSVHERELAIAAAARAREQRRHRWAQKNAA